MAAIYRRFAFTAPNVESQPPEGSDSNFHWGFMVTQDGLTESTGGGTHIAGLHSAAAAAALSSVPNTLMQCAKDHFGVYPVQYTSGVWDWDGSIRGGDPVGHMPDDTVDLIETFRGTNSQLMMQLYGIPGWQAGLAIGNDFTSVAPNTLAHEDAYAADCALFVQRFDGTGGRPNVMYWPVWNEMKGMDNYTTTDRAKYIRIYNKVYNAIKAVRPEVQVGGPYSKMISWEEGMTRGDGSSLYGLSCDYDGGSVDFRVLDLFYEFNRDADGYDFLATDIWAGNDHCTGKQAYTSPEFGPNQDSVAPGMIAYDQMKSKIPACMAWHRAMEPAPLPIISVEFYPQARVSNLYRGAGVDIFTETDVENWMIECLEDCNPYGPGWLCQWGESAEPPRPFDYDDGTATTLISKLIAYEAGL